MSVTLELLPFCGQWLTFWGGDTLKQNYHHDIISQKYAFDFIMIDKNKQWFRIDGKICEDYFSFGQNIVAPADGIAIEVVEGLRDNMPGETNDFNSIGNYIMLKHDSKTYSLLCHLKQNSTLIKVNQKVKTGEKLAQCGNSGNSSAPHLHFQVQNSPVFAKFDQDYNRINIAKGRKVTFQTIQVQAIDKFVIQNNYSPVKGDVVCNIK